MNIRFTNHAKKRCIQRNISEKWIEARLRTIPLSPSLSTHEKMFDVSHCNNFVPFNREEERIKGRR